MIDLDKLVWAQSNISVIEGKSSELKRHSQSFATSQWVEGDTRWGMLINLGYLMLDCYDFHSWDGSQFEDLTPGNVASLLREFTDAISGRKHMTQKTTRFESIVHEM